MNTPTFHLTSTFVKPERLRGAEAALLSIDGMVCSICALNVLGALLGLEGVLLTEVFWEHGQATVAYNPTLVRSDQLVDAVAQAGRDKWHYQAHLLNTMPATEALTFGT